MEIVTGKRAAPEAHRAEYSGIVNALSMDCLLAEQLYHIFDNIFLQGAILVLYVGTKKLVKRKEFEEYIRDKFVI